MKVRKPNQNKMSFTSGSIHSLSVQGDADHHRATTQISRMKQEYDRRLLRYEKEFDVSLSRFAVREKTMKESMLAYTARMRSIENARNFHDSNGTASLTDPLVIRAQHIPRIPVAKNRRRRPASLDELTGKSKERNEALRKNPPKSASHISLPSLPDRLTQGATHHVKISFVSASDLYDIVDFSLRNKGTKAETMKFLQMEAASKQKQSDKEGPQDFDARPTRETEIKRNNFLPPLHEEKKHSEDYDHKQSSYQSDTNVSISKLSVEALKLYRPNRAKRMTLHSSDLDVIPENDPSLAELGARKNRRVRSPPPKMSPRVLLGAKTYLANFNEPSTPPVGKDNKGEKSSQKKEGGDSDLGTVKLGHGIKGSFTNHQRAKYKAHRRFKNLIFLRDVPERKSRI